MSGDLIDLQSTFNENAVLYETHLFEFPLMVLSRRDRQQQLLKTAQDKKSSLRYEFIDKQGNTRYWELKPNAISGYPTDLSVKVLGAVFWLCTQNKQFPPPRMWPLADNLAVIRDVIGRKGQSGLTDVKKALVLWSDTTIKTNAIWLKSKQTYWDDGRGFANFNFWDYYEPGVTLPSGQPVDQHCIDMSDGLRRLMANLSVRPMDFQYWVKMKPKPRRLYEITAPKFYGLRHSPYIEFEYLDLCNKIGISKPKNTIRAAQIDLEDAHEQLSPSHDNWFKQVDWINADETYYTPQNPWRIRYYPTTRYKKDQQLGDTFFHTFCKESGIQPLHSREPISRDEIIAKEIAKFLGKSEQNMGTYLLYARLGNEGKLPKAAFQSAISTLKTQVRNGRVSEKDKPKWFYGYLKKYLSINYAIDLPALFAAAKQRNRR